MIFRKFKYLSEVVGRVHLLNRHSHANLSQRLTRWQVTQVLFHAPKIKTIIAKATTLNMRWKKKEIKISWNWTQSMLNCVSQSRRNVIAKICLTSCSKNTKMLTGLMEPLLETLSSRLAGASWDLQHGSGSNLLNFLR